MRKQRSRQRPPSSQMLSRAGSKGALTPTKEEEPDNEVLKHEDLPAPAILHGNKTPEKGFNQHMIAFETPSSIAIGSVPASGKPTRSAKRLKIVSSSDSQTRKRLTVRSKIRRDTPKLANAHPATSPDSHASQEQLDVQPATLHRGPRIISSETGTHVHADRLRDSTLVPVRRLTTSDPAWKDANARTKHLLSLNDPRRRYKTGKAQSWSTNATDPLARVSNEEDLASLAALAHAMSSSEAPLDTTDGFESQNSDQCNSLDKTAARSIREKDPVLISVLFPQSPPNLQRTESAISNAASGALAQAFTSDAEGRTSAKDLVSINDKAEQSSPISEIQEGRVVLGSVAFLANDSTCDNAQTQNDVLKAAILSPSMHPVSIPAPQRQSFLARNEKEIRNSADHPAASASTSTAIATPRHASRPDPNSLPAYSHNRARSVRELAAKFDNAKRQSTPTSSPVRSMLSARQSMGSPRVGIVAPYTMNSSPSPSKSARSFMSNDSVPSSRAQTPIKRSPTRGLVRAPVFDLIVERKTASSRKATILPAPEEPPVAQFVHYQRPETAPATSIDCPSTARLSTGSAPHVRNNSMLHAQIRTLQRQLSAKTEEAQQLKRQLDTRENLDIGTLSEQLRVTKRDLHIWRSRAEVAENRLEFTRRLPIGVSSGEVTRTSETTPTEEEEHAPSSSCDCCQDRGRVPTTTRIFNTLRNMDGAMSSEDSNATVVHDLHGAVMGTEYSDWVKSTMHELDRAGPHDSAYELK